MEKKDLYKMTDEELFVEKKKLKSAKIFHASFIGFLAGILIFGIVASTLSPEKQFRFVIPMIIPVSIIYKMVKKSKKNMHLEEVLKARNLN